MGDFYVYLHKKKYNGEVFYVGKGTKNRAYEKKSRSKFWHKVVNKYEYIVEIVEYGLQEWYAHELECNLIGLYGRRDRGYGTLVNLTDGGDGFSGLIITEERRKAISERVSGRNHPLYDPAVYTFKNAQTGEIIVCDRYGFENEYPALCISSLFNKSQIHVKKWYIVDSISEYEVGLIAAGFKGKDCKASDKTVYSFYNLHTKEVFSGLRTDLQKKFNVDVSPLFSNIRECLYVKGWTLLSNSEKYSDEYILNSSKGLRNGRSDRSIYNFYNIKTRETVTSTRYDFEKKYGFKISGLFKNNTNSNISHWWCLLENKDNIISKYDTNRYMFQNVSGEVFIGLRSEFKDKYGRNLKNLFSGQCKSENGWTVSEAVL
jgi:hypothetical protein